MYIKFKKKSETHINLEIVIKSINGLLLFLFHEHVTWLLYNLSLHRLQALWTCLYWRSPEAFWSSSSLWVESLVWSVVCYLFFCVCNCVSVSHCVNLWFVPVLSIIKSTILCVTVLLYLLRMSFSFVLFPFQCCIQSPQTVETVSMWYQPQEKILVSSLSQLAQSTLPRPNNVPRLIVFSAKGFFDLKWMVIKMIWSVVDEKNKQTNNPPQKTVFFVMP